ncbi:MAG TPA: hypothetical protein VEQ63_11045, partial [Bryobacteraceae bacterium]|nr:hypothetical protein [Bryobacteraceae bacterium]
ILKDDRSALEWFRLARGSSDPATRGQASKAYENLRPAFQRFTTSAWLYPLYSSRWKNVFTYAQFKSEYKVPGTRMRVYASLRFTGDVRGRVESPVSPTPMFLSESSVIIGGGFSAPLGKGVITWAEAGRAVSYLERPEGRAAADYRGGLSFSRNFGPSIIAQRSGAFAHINADVVFISRFDNDTLTYSQNRWGYTAGLGQLRTQVYWNTNLTADTKRFHWANTVEQGPGIRFRLSFLPESVYMGLDSLSGRFLIRRDNPYGSVFRDFRAGFWYAFSR